MSTPGLSTFQVELASLFFALPERAHFDAWADTHEA